jgi:serpin B
MSHRPLPFLAPSVLLLLAACGGSATGHGSSSSGVPIAQAQNVTRTAASSIDPASVTASVAANNAFAFDLYSHVLASQTTTGNLLTSPVSASLALTMTYAGAQGATATQMASALHLGSASPSTIFDGQNGLSAALTSRASAALAVAQQSASEVSGQPAPSQDDYVVQIVNSVWGEETYPWATPFLTTLAQSYGTGVFLEDFVGQPDPTRQTINAWVSTQTADKINNLLTPGTIDGSTRMVLVNAIHLKLPWDSSFAPSNTQNASFTRADGSAVTAPFMNQTAELSYTDDGRAQVVMMPLTGRALEVVFAMPHGDLASYEAALTGGQATLPLQAANANLALSVPKFTFTSPSVSLAQALQAMGMTQAFDARAAQFQGMCPQTPDGANLYIGDVLQKAMLAVQEVGVEAAAATAVVMEAGNSEPPPPTPVALNKPFVVAIVDQPTGAILFLGHITDPTDTGSQQ